MAIIMLADPSQVAEARRLATGTAKELGFSDEATGRVAIVATELATNILKHAGQGEVVVHRFDDREGIGVEILALDRGPGMAEVGRCLADGYSSAGSRGTGLGAVRRLSQHFGIFSRPGQGTAIVARCRDESRPGSGGTLVVGAVRAVCPGETESGDDWRIRFRSNGARILLADGSGHGPLAARAAARAMSVFGDEPDCPLDVLADRIHRALASTRGAAIALAELDRAAGTLRFVGIGNIAGSLYDRGGVKRFVSMNGTAGHLAPRIREFVYAHSVPVTVILHSDGIGSRWDLATYPGLSEAHPALSAGVLYRDFRRGRDDATAVVLRMEAA